MEILYQDDDLVAVMKPSGMLVHRGWGNDRVVLMTAVRDRLGQWVWPVHRLDRGASGVVLLARSREVAALLGDAFAAGAVDKRYLALVRGIPPQEGVIDHPIPRTEGGPRVAAVTAYRRVGEFGRYGLVVAFPRTGRMHQVRRHLKHIACPIIGDVRYGKGEHNRLFRERYGLQRLALHCLGLTFRHPRSGAMVRVDAEPPPDLAEPLVRIGLGDPLLWAGASEPGSCTGARVDDRAERLGAQAASSSGDG